MEKEIKEDESHFKTSTCSAANILKVPLHMYMYRCTAKFCNHMHGLGLFGVANIDDSNKRCYNATVICGIIATSSRTNKWFNQITNKNNNRIIWSQKHVFDDRIHFSVRISTNEELNIFLKSWAKNQTLTSTDLVFLDRPWFQPTLNRAEVSL